MRNRHNQRKVSSQINIWLVFAVFIIFVLIGFTIFIFYLFSTRPNLLPVPTVQPTEFTSTIAPTSTLTEVPQPSPTLSSPTPQIYIVKQGDTLSSIALEFGITIEALKTANALSSDLIYPDQQLFIPVNPVALTSQATVLADIPVVDATPDLIRYQVKSGDTLESIATDHGVELGDLRAANAMIGDTILPGQFISLPLGPVVVPSWRFSPVNGDYSQGYPLSLETDRFTLHYQPGTLPAQDPNALAQLEQNGLVFLESFTGLRLESHYDVYVAGSNFEPPNRALRGITYSSFLKTFFLHDGTGNENDQQYIAIHELTHMFMWNTVGSPSSTMISEGTAVYIGMEMIKTSMHMPIEEFCAAYLQAGFLPIISASPSFLGHISDLQNYYASGCFVKYLANNYGLESLKLVYHSGDYLGIYGKSLPTLESEWRIQLAAVPLPDGLNPTELVDSVRDLENSYDAFFPGFTGNSTQRDAYRELDKARIALLQGNFIEMRNFLNAFKEIH